MNADAVVAVLAIAGLIGVVLYCVNLVRNPEARNKYVQRVEPDPDRLAIAWARSKGYAIPEEPGGCLWILAIVAGLVAFIVPGLLLLVWLMLQQRDYERAVIEIRNKWIDAGRPAPLPPEH